MSVDVTTLEIKVQTSGINNAENELNKLNKTGSESDGIVGNLSKTFAGFAAAVGGAVSVMAGLEKLVSVTREFDVLNAGLITATGSAENAGIAFGAIEKFATETPYSLSEVTGSFLKLVNMGLNPSERALASYGNTASSMGKDMNDMIEAVADAATGEFERLKEFGIRASKEGDKVSFTFRGMTETVKFSAAEIEQYLIRLGENNFGDAMANRMSTLDGAISNLGDSWDALFRAISEQGAGDAIAQSVNLGIDALNELTAEIASGKLSRQVGAISSVFSGLGDDVARTFDIVSNEFDGATIDIEKFINDALKEIIRLPADFRSWIQDAVVEIVASVQEVGVEFTALGDVVAAVFTDDTIDEAIARKAQALAGINDALKTSKAEIIAERDATIQSFYDQISAADAAREAFDKAAEAKGAGLGRFRVGADGAASSSSGTATSARTGGAASVGATASTSGPDDNSESVTSLALELQQEEELISQSYARRIENRSAFDLMENQAVSTKFMQKMEQWAIEDQYIKEQQEKELADAELFYQRKQAQLDEMHKKNKITNDKYLDLSLLNARRYHQVEERTQQQSNQRKLSNAQIYAGAALSIAGSLFADNKKVSMAMGLISTYEATVDAYKHGAKIGGPVVGAAFAATAFAAQMAQLKSLDSVSIGSSGGGAASVGGGALPSTSSDISSSIPAGQAEKQAPQKVVYLNLSSDGRPMQDDDIMRYSDVRRVIETISEEAGNNVRIVA